jgi:hypothetical protein
MTFAGPAELEVEEGRCRQALASAAATSISNDVPALPLFAPDAVDDEPLVRLPATRPPLAVRRTPDAAAAAARSSDRCTRMRCCVRRTAGR